MSLTISPERIVEESGSPLLAAPESWPRRPLGQVATIINGFAFKSRQFASDGGKPLIRIRDIFNDHTTVGYVGDFDDRYLVRPGELLVGMDGDFNCALWRGPEALLNQRVCKITPDLDQMDLDYLAHILPGYLRAIHDLTSSTTVTHLSSRDIARIPVPVPPVDYQQALAGLFRAAAERQQSCNAHLRVARRSIQRLRQAILVAACLGRLTADWRDANRDAPTVASALITAQRTPKRRTRAQQRLELTLPDLPDSYELSTIGEVATLIEYGTSKRAESRPGGVPILRMGNIQDGQLSFEDMKYREMDGEIRKLLLADGDLLFNRTNSPELVGKSAVFHERASMSFASYLIRVRFQQDVADPDFVNYWMNSAWGRAWAHQVRTDGVSQSNINGTKLAAMPLPLPPIEEQHEIVQRASAMLAGVGALLSRVETASRCLGRSTDSILARALRGELI